MKLTCTNEPNDLTISPDRIRSFIFLKAFVSKLTSKFPDDNSVLVPPDSISNSEVKRTCANDSVVFHHVKVGHRQDFF